MKIEINHLGYTVCVKDIKSFKGKHGLNNILAITQSDSKNQATIYIKKPIKDQAQLAHEVLHVLQWICIDRNISFTEEKEHMGYIMQFLMNEITGFTYKK